MSRLALVSCLALGIIVSGCGGSPLDGVRSSVSNLESVIQTYNGTHPSDLAQTAAACRKAYDDLTNNADLLNTKLGGKRAREERVLRTAYVAARDGFRACASGASTLSYPALVLAQQHLEAANTAIARARRMER